MTEDVSLSQPPEMESVPGTAIHESLGIALLLATVDHDHCLHEMLSTELFKPLMSEILFDNGRKWTIVYR